MRSRNVIPVSNFSVRIELLVKVLGTDNRAVQACKLRTAVVVKLDDVLVGRLVPILSSQEAVCKGPHVTILLNLWKLIILARRHVLDDVIDQAALGREILPHVVLGLLLGRVIDKILNLHHRLPRTGVCNLNAALILVPAISRLVRLVEEVQQNLLVARLFVVKLRARLDIVGICRKVVHAVVVNPAIKLTVHVSPQTDETSNSARHNHLVCVDVIALLVLNAQGN